MMYREESCVAMALILEDPLVQLGLQSSGGHVFGRAAGRAVISGRLRPVINK
jgi:hypothetical protein